MSGIFIEGKWHENTDMICNRCCSPIWDSDVTTDDSGYDPDYTYQCLKCDEDLYTTECKEQSGLSLPRVAIGRNVNGISLNPQIEYLLGRDDEIKVFANQPEAEVFLLQKGVPAEDLEFLFFIEVDHQPDWMGGDE